MRERSPTGASLALEGLSAHPPWPTEPVWLWSSPPAPQFPSRADKWKS